MRRFPSYFALCSYAAVFAACSKSDTDAADTAAADSTAAPAAAAEPAAPAPISLSQLAGRWNVRSVPETGDTTPTTFVLNATADTTGWTITFPNRKPIRSRVVSVGGDSVLTDTGPYESARRKGVQVRTRVAWRLEGDRLTGTTVARYVTKGPDSVLVLRSEGTRAP
jgi:hypothetical protein